MRVATHIGQRVWTLGASLALAATLVAGCLPPDTSITHAPSAPPTVPGGAVLPTLAIKASNQRLRVGDDLTITGNVTRLGKPTFTITNGQAAISVRQDQSLPAGQPLGDLFRLQEARARGDEVVFVLRAVAKGTSSLVLLASGEAEKTNPVSGQTPLPFQTVSAPSVLVIVE